MKLVKDALKQEGLKSVNFEVREWREKLPVIEFEHDEKQFIVNEERVVLPGDAFQAFATACMILGFNVKVATFLQTVGDNVGFVVWVDKGQFRQS